MAGKVMIKVGLIHREIVAIVLNSTIEANAGRTNRGLTRRLIRGFKLRELSGELELLNDQIVQGLAARMAGVIEAAVDKAFGEGDNELLSKIIQRLLQGEAGWIEKDEASSDEDDLIEHEIDSVAAAKLARWIEEKESWAWQEVDGKRESAAPHYLMTDAIAYLEDALAEALGEKPPNDDD